MALRIGPISPGRCTCATFFGVAKKKQISSAEWPKAESAAAHVPDGLTPQLCRQFGQALPSRSPRERADHPENALLTSDHHPKTAFRIQPIRPARTRSTSAQKQMGPGG